MGPDQRKDETPRTDEGPEKAGAERRPEAGDDASVRQQAVDPREEEGWSQPESSAQKGTEPENP